MKKLPKLHHFLYKNVKVALNYIRYDDGYALPVTIGNGCWIGAKSVE